MLIDVYFRELAQVIPGLPRDSALFTSAGATFHFDMPVGVCAALVFESQHQRVQWMLCYPGLVGHGHSAKEAYADFIAQLD